MKRDHSLDFLRIISMLLVIVIHFSNYYCRAFIKIDEISYLGAVIFNSISRVSVPIFFMISGALLIGGNHDNKKYWNRVLKLTLALVIWNLIYYIWNYFYMGTSTPLLTTIITTMFEPTKAHLWFMYAIIGLYIVLPFAQSMLQNMEKEKEDLFIKLWIFFTGIVFISRTFFKLFGIPTDLIYNVPIIQGTYYFGYFAIGYILYKRFEEHKPNMNKYFVLAFLLSSVATIACTFIVSINKNRYYESFLGYRGIFIIVASLSIFMLVLNNKEKINNSSTLIKIIGVLAPTSFGIYLIHIIPFNFLLKNINILEINSFIGIPLLSILIAIISFTAILLLKKIPGMNKLLGI